MAIGKTIVNASSRHVVLAAGLGLILVVLVAKALVLLWLRGDALERYQWHLTNLALALGEETQQSVRSVDLLIEATVVDLKALYGDVRKPSEEALLGRIRERMDAFPQVRSIMFVDASGNSVLDSREFPTTAVRYGEREFFLAQRDKRVNGLYIGKPRINGVSEEPISVFSRRVEDGRGKFRGVVAAEVQSRHFQNIYHALKLGPGGRVFLFRADGILLTVYPPEPNAAGRSFSEDPLFKRELAVSSAGTQRHTGLLDDKQRVIAFERLQDYPLLVMVSSTEDHVLEAWRRYAWRIVIGGSAATAVLGLVLLLLLRQLRVRGVLESELRETGERMRGIVQSAMDGVITVDDEQKIVLFNAAAEQIFRCSARETLGKSLDRLIPERFRAAHRRHIERFSESGTSTRRMGAQLALHGMRADGEEFPIDASISQLAIDGKKLYTVILRDITERRRAEDALEQSYRELSELSAAMHEVREAERMRIARELHDELAQWLTALKMDVSWLAVRLPRDAGQLTARTEKIKSVVDTTVAAVRRIASDLRPVILDDLGLVPAIEYLLHGFSERTGIVVSLDVDATGFGFKDPLATAVYRMLQEALTNVARHAEASEVQVTIRLDDDQLVVRVRDNGKGIDLNVVKSEKSFGILGIKERARTLAGRANIYRHPESGTVVEITLPAGRYRTVEAS